MPRTGAAAGHQQNLVFLLEPDQFVQDRQDGLGPPVDDALSANLSMLISGCIRKYSWDSVRRRNSLLTRDSPISGVLMCNRPNSESSFTSCVIFTPELCVLVCLTVILTENDEST